MFDQGGVVGEDGEVTKGPGHEVPGHDERGDSAAQAVDDDQEIRKKGEAGSGAGSNVGEGQALWGGRGGRERGRDEVRAFEEEMGAELGEEATGDEAEGAQKPTALAKCIGHGQDGGAKDRGDEDQDAASKGASPWSVCSFGCSAAVGGRRRGWCGRQQRGGGRRIG